MLYCYIIKIKFNFPTKDTKAFLSTQKGGHFVIFKTLFYLAFRSYFANELIVQGVSPMSGRIKKRFSVRDRNSVVKLVRLDFNCHIQLKKTTCLNKNTIKSIYVSEKSLVLIHIIKSCHTVCSRPISFCYALLLEIQIQKILQVQPK